MNDGMSRLNQPTRPHVSSGTAGSCQLLRVPQPCLLSPLARRVPADGRAHGAGVAVKERHEADGGAALASAEAAPAADPHLLERLLQLWPVRLLPGTHHPGPAVSDRGHRGADHLGLLLPAVLPVGGQLRGGALQENVSAASSLKPRVSRGFELGTQLQRLVLVSHVVTLSRGFCGETSSVGNQ